MWKVHALKQKAFIAVRKKCNFSPSFVELTVEKFV